jgi:hypothetical protein
MKKTFPYSLGMTVGAVVGLIHIVWSLLVAAGKAQAWVNWVAKLHFIDPPAHVNTFDLGTAILLVIVTSLIGFIVGYVFGVVWTRMRQS